MPKCDREKCTTSHGTSGKTSGNNTFHVQLSEVPFKVIDGREKDLHVEDELFGHSYRF